MKSSPSEVHLCYVELCSEAKDTRPLAWRPQETWVFGYAMICFASWFRFRLCNVAKSTSEQNFALISARRPCRRTPRQGIVETGQSYVHTLCGEPPHFFFEEPECQCCFSEICVKIKTKIQLTKTAVKLLNKLKLKLNYLSAIRMKHSGNRSGRQEFP